MVRNSRSWICEIGLEQRLHPPPLGAKDVTDARIEITTSDGDGSRRPLRTGAAAAAWLSRNDWPSVAFQSTPESRASVENRQSFCQARKLRGRLVRARGAGCPMLAPGRLHRAAAALTIAKRAAADLAGRSEGSDHMKRPLRRKRCRQDEETGQPISVEPLLPVPIPHTTARFARGIRAGRWVFATGQSGTDYVNGLAPEVVQADRPLNGESHSKRETRRSTATSGRCLPRSAPAFRTWCASISIIRPSARCIPITRSVAKCLQGRIPPSTSNLHQRFSRTGQTIEIQVMAAVPGSGLTVKHETFKPSYNISPVSGYSPALSAGDFRFVPGQTAEARKDVTVRLIPRRAIRARCGANGRSSSKPISSSSAS